jgi:hypothetical protein
MKPDRSAPCADSEVCEESDPFTRCEGCGERDDECICGDVATEGHGQPWSVERLLDGFYGLAPPRRS